MTDLTSVYKELLKVLPTDIDTKMMVMANIKPRLIMTMLYYMGQSLGKYLVAGTGNRSELAIGYFTKFGDGAADLMPLGGLLKRDVRRIGEYLGLPRAILDKPPSADLWPGQTDEKELGASYEILDRIVAGESRGIDAKLVKTLKERIKNNQHKDPEGLLKGYPSYIYHYPEVEEPTKPTKPKTKRKT